METNKENAAIAQGAEAAKVEGAETIKVEKKKQAVSKSYTVKAFGNNIKNLKECGLINQKDYEALKQTHEKIVKQFIGEQLL